MTSRAGLASPVRVTSPASRRDRAHRLGAWGKTLRARGKWLRKELAPQANRPTFAGEPRRKCPRNRSGSPARWVFGESLVLLRRAIVAVSLVMGRVGSGRRGFGCWVARVSAGALQPESDSRVSAVFATCRGPGCRSARGGVTRTTRIVSRGLAPFAGKGRASARAATGDGCSTSVERPKPLGSGLSLLACQ
jgi:hypothetical protein